MMYTLALRVAALFLAAVGLGQAASAGYIHAKAALAQVLIREAWVEAGRAGAAPKPWPWADTTPVARLSVPAHRVDLIVLEGGSGRTLAFGPGHVTGTPLPGRRGNAVIGGHRDTHFRFLKDVEKGERITIESVDGAEAEYVVTGARVVDHREVEIQGDFGDDRLTLITCYPFDAIQAGGPLRYIVTAIRDNPTGTLGAPTQRTRSSLRAGQ